MSHSRSRHRAPTIHTGSNKEPYRLESVPTSIAHDCRPSHRITAATHRSNHPATKSTLIIVCGCPSTAATCRSNHPATKSNPMVVFGCALPKLKVVHSYGRDINSDRKSTSLRACVMCQTNSFSYWDSAKLLIFWTVGRYWGSHDNRHDRLRGGNELVFILTDSYKVILITARR